MLTRLLNRSAVKAPYAALADSLEVLGGVIQATMDSIHYICPTSSSLTNSFRFMLMMYQSTNAS
jgi:hypothetical protein